MLHEIIKGMRYKYEEIEEKYRDELSGDVSWFCKKFDYRFDGEPWYNAKGSVNRGIKFLAGSFDEEPWQK